MRLKIVLNSLKILRTVKDLWFVSKVNKNVLNMSTVFFWKLENKEQPRHT